MNTAYTRKYYNIILVMSFTLLSENSVCLQIMFVTMTFPKMERKLYLPFPIILFKKFNMSRLPSCRVEIKREFMRPERAEYSLFNSAKILQ